MVSLDGYDVCLSDARSTSRFQVRGMLLPQEGKRPAFDIVYTSPYCIAWGVDYVRNLAEL